MTTSSITSRRSVHLVDLENLVGDPRARGDIVGSTFERYLDAARWQGGDHVIVASNPTIIRELGFEPRVAANVHATRGEDGADLMLLSLASPELVARRYGRLVIGSGDGIFAARAHAAKSLGTKVSIVALRDHCSRKLFEFDCSFLDQSQASAA